MTTIACNRSMMAADSLGNTADIKYRVRKLHRAKSGAIVGCSGTLDHGLMLAHWYDRGGNLFDRPHGQDFNATGLVLDESGIYRFEGECYPIPVLDPFAAIGSGAAVALAAMMLGKSPKEAVELACEIDLNTGPPVVVERL